MHFLKQLFTSFGLTLLLFAAVILLVIVVCFMVSFLVDLAVALGAWLIVLVVFGIVWYIIHKELF